MQTFNDKQKFVGVLIRFFDVDGKPAKIDTSQRQPGAIFDNPSVASAENIVVADDAMSLTLDVVSGAVGQTPFAMDVDVNLDSGVDTSVVMPIDTIETTPSPAGPAASASSTFPAPVDK